MADRLFPLTSDKTAWNSVITETWSVTEQTSASGRRRAVCNQLYPQYSFDVTFPALTDAEIDLLMGFYAQCKGSLLPFYYKDAVNYRVESQQLSQNASGAYNCVIKKGNYVEPCSKVDNLTVFKDGVKTTAYTETNGVINIEAGNSVITASYNYYWYVKFSGELSVVQMVPNVNKVSLKLLTVR